MNRTATNKMRLRRDPPQAARLGRILFVSERGERLSLSELTQCMRVYLKRAKLGKTGGCHIFRHSMATHMLEATRELNGPNSTPPCRF